MKNRVAVLVVPHLSNPYMEYADSELHLIADRVGSIDYSLDDDQVDEQIWELIQERYQDKSYFAVCQRKIAIRTAIYRYRRDKPHQWIKAIQLLEAELTNDYLGM